MTRHTRLFIREHLTAFKIVLYVSSMIILIYSQQARLNEYSNWYCTEIYGLDQNCNQVK